MRFDTAQHMRTDQQMKLAPRMIQSMEILQLPLLALQERIEQELESNIALELVEPDERDGDDDGVTAREEERTRDDSAEGDGEEVVGDEGGGDGLGDDFERLSDLESSYRDSFEYESSTYRPNRSGGGGDRDGKMDALAALPSRRESLAEQLQHQWVVAEVEPDVAAVGAALIEYIDDDGLLSVDDDTLIQQLRADSSLSDVDENLIAHTVRELQFWLEPPGVAARNSREALLLQVDHFCFSEESSGDGWEDVRVLIDDHYDDLLENRVPRIAERADWPMERVQAAIALMRRLDPTPGRQLVDDEVPPVIPDVAIEYDEQSDEYVAVLNEDLMPGVRVAERYQQMARDRQVDAEAREFAAKSVQSASWLIDAVRQRKATLLRVVNAVIARQRDYFDRGSQYLRPMPMIDVADQLGVHVATISRAVAGKWVRTPRGIVPLRMFFSGGTSTESGEQMAWEAVRATLKEIIDAEDKSKPLSDEALAQELKKQGIDIARRTVVKYRQQLDIPPARRRRVYEIS